MKRSLEKKVNIENQISILKDLERNSLFSQRQLAQNSSMSLGKIKYSYILTPKGISEKSKFTKRFLKLKIEEYDALADEIDALKSEMDDK